MRIAHVGIHRSENRNAGDTVLFVETRRVIETLIGTPVEWRLLNLWEPVTEALVADLNQTADLIVIGGGGVFLRDQTGAEASVSGWQWNCSVESLRQLRVPLALFGVGYNRFRDQPDFDPVFTHHLNLLAERSIFLGLRNHGSLANLAKYLDPVHHPKLRLQPCPTTVISRTRQVAPVPSGTPVVSVNLAYDRPQYRFAGREAEALAGIDQALALVRAAGYRLSACLHKAVDREIAERLTVPLDEVVDVSAVPPEDVITYYQGIHMAVGMRGHGQLIPFGLNRRIVSVVSHDKMQYFLDDIGHPEWGADVRQPGFGAALATAVLRVLDDGTVPDQLRKAQDVCWDVTRENVALLTGGRS